MLVYVVIIMWHWDAQNHPSLATKEIHFDMFINCFLRMKFTAEL